VGISQDHLAVDRLEQPAPLGPVAVDERRLAVEALAVSTAAITSGSVSSMAVSDRVQVGIDVASSSRLRLKSSDLAP
jgi:hypothetical protein